MIETIYERVLWPVLSRMDPETAHNMALLCLRAVSQSEAACRVLARRFVVDDPRLHVDLPRLLLERPIILAAGFDKGGRAVPACQAFGFGAAEIGSVTLRPWLGNPRPRLWRIPEHEALANRMGLNSPGARKVFEWVFEARWRGGKMKIGISVAKTPLPMTSDEAIKEVATAAVIMASVADSLIVNLGCPNTTDGRDFEDPDLFEALIDHLKLRLEDKQRRSGIPLPPLYVKVSPQLCGERLRRVVEI